MRSFFLYIIIYQKNFIIILETIKLFDESILGYTIDICENNQTKVIFMKNFKKMI